MATTSEHIRTWTGPAILSFGFRPFFLLGAAWAALAMALWLAMLTGGLALPTAFDPVSWYAHEFLFGYLGAIVAGFLLTAVPNWTGRLPIVGWGLGGLVLLWFLGRLAVAVSGMLSAWGVAAVDLAFPVALALAIASEIVAGRNWRNLIVLGMLLVMIVGNTVFHAEAAAGDYAVGGYGFRIGLAAGVMMVSVIGGRIVPSFTRNWLVKHDPTRLPTPPMQRFVKVALIALLMALSAWIAVPDSVMTGALLLVAGALHLLRLARWRGVRTTAEPLVMVLHLGYLFVPLGALVMGTAGVWPQIVGMAVAQHVWMAGAIGLMTLAVMTRATLGHTGRALHAVVGTVALYAALIVAVLARLAAGMWPALASELHAVSGIGWIAAFSGFAVIYGALLLRPKPD
ncbi:MAG: NnrS family protein [Pseudomonadota bacterium]